MVKGLSVMQGDADADLADYPNDAFDYVILSQTLQATRQPRVVLENMLRIGRRAIVSVPNFGHWSVRLQLALRGRMPVTEQLSHSWYDTPNIHFCTITDFIALAREAGAVIDRSVASIRRAPSFPRYGRNGPGTWSASRRSSSCTMKAGSEPAGRAPPRRAEATPERPAVVSR